MGQNMQLVRLLSGVMLSCCRKSKRLTKLAKLLLSTGHSCPSVSMRRHKVGICRRTCATSFVTKKVFTPDTAGKHRTSIAMSANNKEGLQAAPGAYDRKQMGAIPESQNDRTESLRVLRGGTSLQVTPCSSAALKRAASASGVCSRSAAGRKPAFNSVLCWSEQQRSELQASDSMLAPQPYHGDSEQGEEHLALLSGLHLQLLA